MSFLRFYVAKSDKGNCYGCGAQILEGEEFCVQFVTKNVGGAVWKRTMLFHTVDCYQKWLDDSYVRQLLNWRLGKEDREPRIRPKRGRPVTKTEPTKEEVINRLKTLQNYHKKIGGRDKKVKHLQGEIDKLKSSV